MSALPGLRFAAFYLYPLLLYPFVQATLQSSFSGFIVGAAAEAVLIVAMIAVFVPRYRVPSDRRHHTGRIAYV
jgi:hypothetical protein